jgi:DNA-binding transcriptional regulator YdaS (Cro superfamily)
MSSSLDEVETVSERAERLGVSPRYIQQLCKSGKLAARYAKSGTSGVWLILKFGVSDPSA